MASHEVLIQNLTEMGFESSLISKALKQLGDKATIESVINLIEEIKDNVNDEVSTEDKTEDKKDNNEENNTEDNATKESANNESDSTEDKEKLKREYEEKMRQRRILREEKEKEEELKREIKRREDGKGMGKMKEELEQLQRKRVAEEMRREKAEAQAAKQAVLDQIARDREEQRLSRMPTNDLPKVVTPPAQPTVAKDGKCRLAIRLLDGKQLVNEFDNREPLSAVRVYVITQSGTDCDISFVMPPRSPFTEEDMQKPLNALGLCPSARVHVIKR